MPIFPDTSGVTDAINYCASNPTDPKCNGSQRQTWQAAAVSFVPTGPGTSAVVTTPATTPTIALLTPVTPWYKTWWILGLLAAAGVVGYKKFVAKA